MISREDSSPQFLNRVQNGKHSGYVFKIISMNNSLTSRVGFAEDTAPTHAIHHRWLMVFWAITATDTVNRLLIQASHGV